MSALEPYELDFIRDVYPAWSVTDISDKLSQPTSLIKAALKAMGLTAYGSDKLRRTTLDWPSIWYAYTRVGTIDGAANATGYDRAAVRYAIVTMQNMSEFRLKAYWDRFAESHDRERYEAGDIELCLL